MLAVLLHLLGDLAADLAGGVGQGVVQLLAPVLRPERLVVEHLPHVGGELVVPLQADERVVDDGRRVAGRLVLRVLVDDLLELRQRLLEVIVGPVDPRLEELHHHELLVVGILDVLDVDVEGREHLLLALGDRLLPAAIAEISRY